jgi:hypothetical protein
MEMIYKDWHDRQSAAPMLREIAGSARRAVDGENGVWSILLMDNYVKIVYNDAPTEMIPWGQVLKITQTGSNVVRD